MIFVSRENGEGRVFAARHAPCALLCSLLEPFIFCRHSLAALTRIRENVRVHVPGAMICETFCHRRRKESDDKRCLRHHGVDTPREIDDAATSPLRTNERTT
uniref:Uncharacterized protein n=1 Tax=Odontella aurita TaxID=265563 RepID=A0A7S4MW27_9STRA